jgi:hypothetical protein
VLRHGALRVHDGRERCDGVVRGEQGRVEAEARVVVGTTEDEEGVVSGGEKDVVALVERGRGLERSGGHGDGRDEQRGGGRSE